MSVLVAAQRHPQTHTPSWDVVDSSVVPRVAPQNSPRCKHRALEGAVSLDCLQSVVGARRVVAASGSEGRGDSHLVKANCADQHRRGSGFHSRGCTPQSLRAHARPTLAIDRRRALDTSAARDSKDDCAASGRARTTTWVPSGTVGKRSRMIARKRRFTRLRTTAPPTVRETAKPAMLGASPVNAI